MVRQQHTCLKFPLRLCSQSIMSWKMGIMTFLRSGWGTRVTSRKGPIIAGMKCNLCSPGGDTVQHTGQTFTLTPSRGFKSEAVCTAAILFQPNWSWPSCKKFSEHLSFWSITSWRDFLFVNVSSFTVHLQMQKYTYTQWKLGKIQPYGSIRGSEQNKSVHLKQTMTSILLPWWQIIFGRPRFFF